MRLIRWFRKCLHRKVEIGVGRGAGVTWGPAEQGHLPPGNTDERTIPDPFGRRDEPLCAEDRARTPRERVTDACYHVGVSTEQGDFAARIARTAATFILLAYVSAYVLLTMHWPLIGDATLVHYVVLLLEHGLSPYRQIIDTQMPGAYLVDWVAMHTFGSGPLGLRLFDFTLLLAAGLSMLWIAWPQDRFAAACAATIFALLHGRDGIPQTAQRDLIMAVLMLAGFAFAFRAIRRGQAKWMLAFGLCAGTAMTIKPTLAPLVLLLLFAALALRGRGRRRLPAVLWGSLGTAVPLAAVFVFLWRERAIAAFTGDLFGMWPYYAGLGDRPYRFLLVHSVSPMMPFVALWLIVLAAGQIQSRTDRESFASKKQVDWERWALWFGLALGAASYLGQRKGFPYHRYPLLAFLLLMMAMDFSAATRRRGLLRVAGIAALASWVFFVAPVSLYKISTYNWHDDQTYSMLHSDIDRLGGPALSGHIQCLDTFSGCINALYRMRLVESTGFLADFYFWTPGRIPVREQMRHRFWSVIQANPPWVFIVMKQDYPSLRTGYGKLKRWPKFDTWLNANYRMTADRTGTRTVHIDSIANPPVSYRIYVRDGVGSTQ